MHTTFALAALAAVAYARPQGVTENIAPQASAPEGCSPSYSGSFQIQAVNFTTPAVAKVCHFDLQSWVLLTRNSVNHVDLREP